MLEEYYKNTNSKKTEKFHILVNTYRDELRKIWTDYENKEEGLKAFKGSSGYEQKMKEIYNERESKISELKQNYKREFVTLFEGIEKMLDSRKAQAPTQEELNALVILSSMNQITRDEIKETANSFNSPLALKKLQELALQKQIYGVKIDRDMTTDEAREVLSSMKDGATRLLSMNKVNIRHIIGDNRYSEEEKRKALYSFRIDTDTKTTTDTLGLYGGINFTELQKFNSIID